MGIEAIYRRPHTSKPADEHEVYPYLLRGMTVERPNQVWAMDIRYIPMARGFVFLTAVVDWFSRRVLAWRVSARAHAYCRYDTGHMVGSRLAAANHAGQGGEGRLAALPLSLPGMDRIITC